MNKINYLCLLLILLLFPFISVSAQEVNISGVVIDNEGLTMPGVSVAVKGATSGTITDLDGKFNISVPKGTTLIFSFIGYTTKEVKVGNESILNITLNASTVGLDEVVVVGYGTQSRRTITSAITKVSGDALKNVPVNTIGEGLKGKIAGARLYSNNNTPGADATIRIRGGSSINKSNDPLILVDGVERAFSGINPNDIESIEVLKDAASTAIYGSRASNGVILITTKKGSANQAPRITFEANVALQQAETLYDFMSAEDYLNIVRPAVAVGPNSRYNSMDGYSASSGNTASSIYSKSSGSQYAAAYDKTVANTLKYLKPEDNVLEFACGTGIVTLQVAPHVAHLRAIDISDQMASKAAAKVEAAGLSNTLVTNTDLFDPCLEEGRFDAVLAYNVLCYVDTPQQVLSRIRSLLKPGGLFLSATDCLGEQITKVGVKKFWKSHTGSMPYVAFYSMKKLEEEIARNGFTVLERENLFPAPPNLFLAARRED